MTALGWSRQPKTTSERSIYTLQKRSSKPGLKGAANNGLPEEAVVRRFLWAIQSLCVQVERVDNVWASKLGVTGPQWLILTALADDSEAAGIPVNKLAKYLHVDPSFITTQTKILERIGLLVRRSSAEDARVVLIGPTDKFWKLWHQLSPRRTNLHNFVFSGLSDKDLERVTTMLLELGLCLEKAATLTALDAESGFWEK
jgi:DNA-binding MarR family transcriptional regulator